MISTRQLLMTRVVLLIAVLATACFGGGIYWSSASTPLPTDHVSSTRQLTTVDEGWTTLFGPRHDSISREGNIRREWPTTGPPIHWRTTIGSGYSSPVAIDDLVYILHRVDDEEIVEAFHIETGASEIGRAHV